ncbi:MAG: AmmeMemoRadiSam system radical SAM enzyme [candidate division Zixibacteria bacterium]|nr:AmmeMemoRadiSam system radical SAM enzyme [candidate division Zixibacteria bacterium]
MKKEATYYEKFETGNKVKCLLCPANCLLTDGKIGICGSRFNDNGKLIVDNFGELVSACYDPIEKKPLYHFYPGSLIFSTGANGCNFNCSNCQNWEISQKKIHTKYVAPEDLLKYAGNKKSIGVAYTYTEPLIWIEYIRHAGRLIREAGLKNVLVTNGYINNKPLKELLPIIDAANIDLKSMESKVYKKICKGRLEPVLENIRTFYDSGVHIEITNLLITGVNDSDSDIERITDFVGGISKSIPMHFSAYFPTYKMNYPATSPERMLRAFEIASCKLDYVYLGNINIPGKSNSLCPECNSVLIHRSGYSTELTGLNGKHCDNCGQLTNIIN